MQEIRLPFLGREDPLEEEMATRCSISAWRIPWAEEPGGWLTQLTLGSGLGLGWGLGSELSSLTTKQFSHERMEWAVKKDPSPGSGRTEAKYTHTPCCPPKVLWEVYGISNVGPPCATGGSRVNPSERKASLEKEMKWVWGHDEPVSGSLCWPVPQLLVSTLIRQPPARVTGQGQRRGGKPFPQPLHWDITLQKQHSVHLPTARCHTGSFGSFPVISAVSRNIHLRKVPPCPFYKWENRGQSIHAHAAGKHTKRSSESLSEGYVPVLSTLPTHRSLKNTFLNTAYRLWGGKRPPMVVTGPAGWDNRQAFISQHRTLQCKRVSISWS